MGSGISYKNLLNLFCIAVFAFFGFWSSEAYGQNPVQTSSGDTTRKSPLKLQDETGIPWETKSNAPLFLDNPSNIKTTIVYNPEKDEYVIYQKVGAFDYRTPVHMSPEEFRKYQFNKEMRDYWQSRISGVESGFKSNLIPQIEVGGAGFDKIFGSNVINIVPQGSAELVFGVNISKTDNPTLSERLRTIPTFDFKEKIQMNVTGTIGDKVQLGVNYNTEAMFDFENKTKLQYTGKEDEIVKKIEAGDVTLPLTGTLIAGSYSLFGLKTELQFGKLNVTAILSQQKGQSSTINVKGGAQVQSFEIYADDYEANRHFFLSQYFRDIYDNSLKNLPNISSGVHIERLEVWITNKTSSYDETRNIVAFADLAENKNHIFNKIAAFQATPGALIYPQNDANRLYEQLTTTYSAMREVDQVTNAFSSLYPGFQIGRDFEKIENARKLKETEYTLNSSLGYISLNSALASDEVLAVAYEYTLNGQVYKVGEFSTDGIAAPKTLILKLLKGTTESPKYPTWNLMMKNVYSLGSGKIQSSSNFQLNVLYEDDKTGNSINYLPEGKLANKILLQVLDLDNLNSQNDRQPDGYFDFIDGVTVNVSKGKIIFPVLEPFGSYLKKQIDDPVVASKYVFQELYDSTQTMARQMAEKNKFKMAGQYTSASGSEIRLNATNIPQGSVKVTAGGVTLTENTDFTVDYNLGVVTIINSALIESETPIQVSLENNQFFGYQTKTLLGTHLDYKFSDNFNIGGTILHLNERPYTEKVSYGEEPISNTIWGLNTAYKSESQFLTKLIDKIPLLNTKAPSKISFNGEFADLVPGHSKAITKSGNSYIDDFESSEIPLDLKAFTAWTISSVPQGQEDLFPEAKFNNNLVSGFNRAKIAWYVIDPLFLENGSSTPPNIKNNPDTQSSHFVREIYENEIFPNKPSATGIPNVLAVLNVAFYPGEKGPYNYDTEAGSYSRGMNQSGNLNNPESRWGGIMREISTSDFEAANIQYIEFWLMDPFVENPTGEGGDLYFNLGDISEDILRDSRKSFENGLPTTATVVNVDTTVWGRVSTIQSVVNAFDNSSESRKYQDVGLDGLSDADEQTFFSDYLKKSALITTPATYATIQKDPSGDDFHYFRGSDYDQEQLGILDRYKKYNGEDGNSPTSEMSKESYPTAGSTLPDMEDINHDNTLNETESYYQYKVSLRPADLVVGKNDIVDQIAYTATFANGKKSTVNWYQFKIPITEYQKAVGAISDFKSIRFMRMFLRNFTEPVIMRFAEMNLMRAEWRKYNLTFMEGGERITIPEETDASFEIGSVGIEENGSKIPVNYVLPPGFNRQVDPSNPQLVQLDEKSMVLKVLNLNDGDARAAYKTVNLDMRDYRRLRMEVHAEAITGQALADNDLTAFIRMGTDYTSNFYEYEVPLKLTPPGHYNEDSDDSRAIVWPSANSFNIDLSVLQNAKTARNTEMKKAGSSLSLSDVYSYADGSNMVYVCGNPNLANVKVIMIGVRNPIRTRSPSTDDGKSKSAEVWVNELRLNDFKEDGGWAANAHLQAKLADLGTVDIVGQMSTPGWGSIDKTLNERSKETDLKYDISSSLELGKFFPEKLGVRLPVYIGLSETRVIPEYNPLDPDILLKDALKAASGKAARDSIKNLAEEISKRKTFTISNAGISKIKGKKHAWDPSNFSLNYTYNETYTSNTTTEINLEKNIKGGIDYNYEANPVNIMPFKNVKFLNSPLFRIIKDFNFYPFPKNISFRNDVTRYYNEVKTRNIDDPNLIIQPTFSKDLRWTRIFDIKYDVTRQLKIDFTSTNIAKIDEPAGPADKKRYPGQYAAWRDSVLNNIKHLGRTVSYYHTINATYNLPINKLPMLSWLTASTKYSADYRWTAGAIYPDSMHINLGNTIENNSDFTLTSMANLATFYTKLKFLKNIENDTKPDAVRRMKSDFRTVTFTRSNVNFKANTVKSIIHNLNTKDVKLRVLKKDGSEVKGKVDIVSENKINFTPSEKVEKGQVIVEGKVPKKRDPLKVTGEYLIRALMGIRSISLNYNSSQQQYLPGFLPKPSFMGLSKHNGTMAPGLPFVLGLSNKSFFDRALRNGWLTTDTLMNTAANYSKKTDLSLRSIIEPFPGLKIDLNMERRFLESENAYYTANSQGNFPDSTRNRIMTGNFSMSIISWGTAFEKIKKGNEYISPTFEAFQRNTVIISERRAQNRQRFDQGYDPNTNPDGTLIDGPYKSGYGETSGEVLIPAFYAAYTKSNPLKVDLSTFPSAARMMPNWRLTFDGLSKFPFVQRFLKSVSLSHQYRSVYQIGSYSTNLSYVDDGNGLTSLRDLQENFLQKYEINSVSISEQFSPLINIDMNWKNSLNSRFEWKKSRTVTLDLANNQVIDARVNELVFGAGYRFNNVTVILKTQKSQKSFKSDLNVRLDLSIRDNKTLTRTLVEDVNQPVSGVNVFTISATADYVLSDKFSLQVFADHTVNNPFVATTYPTSNTDIGFTLKFTLAK